MADSESLPQLREAIRLSPKNLSLRRALADSLLGLGHFVEAETELRAALQMAPEDMGLKLGLARAFQQQGKRSHALVLLEDLVRIPEAPGRAFVLYAKLLAGIGELDLAVENYRRGVDKEASAADAEFALRYSIRLEPIRSREEDVFRGSDDDDDDVMDGRIRESWENQDEESGPEIERPKITFAEVGGMETIKEEIRLKIIYPIIHADLYKAYGKAIGGGILLYGPPGCGKTHLARAAAGEIKAAFISVGIHDVMDMWLGNSERTLHQLFVEARRNTPCVLFFDEVDALGASRSDMKSNAGRHLINQFLSELDGYKSANDGVLILGATNAPWHLDSAFRRPGRFDRILLVPPPDLSTRVEILSLQMRGKPMENIDFQAIAELCEGFSGADLRGVVEVAVENKLREVMKAGLSTPLRTRDLVAALGSQRASTRDWFATARNYALHSNQGGLYDDIFKYMKL